MHRTNKGLGISFTPDAHSPIVISVHRFLFAVLSLVCAQGALAQTSSGTQRVTFRRVERGGIDLIFFFSY